MTFDEIRPPDAVDAEWLTAALHARGIGTASRIVGFEARSIGTGQVGENIRYVLSWDGDDHALPASVVAKFPSASPVSRATAVQVDAYRREVGFYRDLQPVVSIRTPHVHHVGWDPATHDFVLLMDDVRDAVQGDQLAGCDVVRAQAVVDEAVGLHAPTWDRAGEFERFEWVSMPTAERTEQLHGLFSFTLPGFLDRYADRLSADEQDIGRLLVERYPAIAAAVADWAASNSAWCITHADYRLDNILFGATPAAPPVTVVDWQTAAVGIGPADVAYFVGAGLLPDDRRSHEPGLVDRYAAGLVAAGVDVDPGTVREGYVLGTAGGYLMAVLASQVVERTERGDDMFVAMATRHAGQIADNGLADLI